MKEKKIKKILAAQSGELSSLCGQVGHSFDKETIHDFRVAVKTFRAVLRLLRMHTSDKRFKLPKKFKRLYHISGAIRDAQLEIEKITGRQPVFPVYLDTLHRMLLWKKQEWHKRYTTKTVHKYGKQLAHLQYGPLPPAALTRFTDLKMAAVHKLATIKSPADNEVHEIRKLVKDVLYITMLAKKYWKPAYNEIQNCGIKQLEQAAAATGEYNDSRIMLEHLQAFKPDAMEPGEQVGIAAFCNAEAARLKKEKKKTLAFVRKELGIGL